MMTPAENHPTGESGTASPADDGDAPRAPSLRGNRSRRSEYGGDSSSSTGSARSTTAPPTMPWTRSNLADRGRRGDGDHGPVGRRQVHAAQHDRRPGPAHPRQIVVDGIRVDRLNEAASARFRRLKVGFIFQSFHLLEELTRPRQRGRAGAAGGHRARPTAQARPTSSWVSSAWAMQPAATRRRSAAASGSASRSRERWSTGRRCCSPTSRPGRSTARTADSVLALLDDLDRRGQTIVLVTHDRRWPTRGAPGRPVGRRPHRRRRSRGEGRVMGAVGTRHRAGLRAAPAACVVAGVLLLASGAATIAPRVLDESAGARSTTPSRPPTARTWSRPTRATYRRRPRSPPRPAPVTEAAGPWPVRRPGMRWPTWQGLRDASTGGLGVRPLRPRIPTSIGSRQRGAWWALPASRPRAVAGPRGSGRSVGDTIESRGAPAKGNGGKGAVLPADGRPGWGEPGCRRSPCRSSGSRGRSARPTLTAG